MTPLAIIEVLSNWRDLLDEVASITFNSDIDQTEIDKQMSRRQRAIDGIQKLDGSLARVSDLRRIGWPGLDQETSAHAEKLVREAMLMCQQAVQQDKQFIEIIKEKRSFILEQLKNTDRSRGYAASSKHSPIGLPIIVDNRA